MNRFFFTPILIIVLIIIGCQRSSDITAPQNSNGSSVAFHFVKPANLDTLVVFAEAMVSAPDMDTILVDLTIHPNSVEGTIENIPAGPHRKFEIFTYDADTNLTYYGHGFADVPAGQVITLQIVLYPVSHTGTVIIVGTFAQYPPPAGKIVFRADYTGSFDIYIMNPNANNIVNITNTPGLQERYARISPDGQSIAFIRVENNNIARPYIMDVNGGNPAQLNIHPGSHVGYIDWAPNGERVVVNSYFDGDAEIYTYDLSTGQDNQLTFNDSANDWVPQWSPTGNWIAYQSDESGIFKIKLIHPDGSGEHTLFPNSVFEEKYPSFSPDGTMLAFYGRDGSTWDLFIADTDGTNLTRLTNTSGINEYYGCWSPDGQKILFTRFDGINKGLYLFNLQGGAITSFLDTPNGEEDFSHWR